MDVLSLIPTFGGLIWIIVAFVAALSIIVAVHEYGHYIVGRWSGIHAEVFSLGFGPVLFSRVDRRGTRWQVAALPLGGYVKFFGDKDAASGKDAEGMAQLTPQERRHTMHGAPLWARTATVAAGPIFNFILSAIVFAGFFMVQGVATDTPVVGSVKPLPGTAWQQLQPGDRIVSVAGKETPDYEAFGAVTEELAKAPTPTVSWGIERGGAAMTVEGPFPLPPVVDGVTMGSAAQAAGIEEGDVILAVDGRPVTAFAEMSDIVRNSGGAPMLLSVWRGGETLEATLTPKRVDNPLPEGGFETRWLLGLSSSGPVFAPETRTPGPLEAVTLAGTQIWMVVTTSLSAIGHIVTGAISSCNLSGPISIAETSGAAASLGIANFIWWIAMLSTAVGLMNLFPVPILDGGHLVFYAWEAATGRPPSDRALRVLMGAGLAAILGLMVFALTNDIFCP